MIGRHAKTCQNGLVKQNTHLGEYDKVKRFSFYLGDDFLLLVSAEKDADINVVVDQVIQTVLQKSRLKIISCNLSNLTTIFTL